MDAGREIFATALLPDRKLRWLAQQPLASLPPGRDGERRLMLWVFEDALKQRWAARRQLAQAPSRSRLASIPALLPGVNKQPQVRVKHCDAGRWCSE